MWLRKKFNVYIVFVTTTISTWVNDKLHEPTWNTFDQPPCLMIWRSFNAWFMSRIQVNLPNNKHFEGLSREGMSRGGGYSIIMHFLFLPILPHSCFCVDPHAIWWHKKELTTSSLPLPLSSSNIAFPSRLNQPMNRIQEKFEQVYNWWGAFNPDNILNIVTVSSVNLFKPLVKIHLQKLRVFHGGGPWTGSTKRSMD